MGYGTKPSFQLTSNNQDDHLTKSSLSPRPFEKSFCCKFALPFFVHPPSSSNLGCSFDSPWCNLRSLSGLRVRVISGLEEHTL